MLTQEQAVEIRVLARRGMGLREIARQKGPSRNTARRYLRQPEIQGYGPRAPRHAAFLHEREFKQPA